MAGIGLSWPSKLTDRPKLTSTASRSSSSRCCLSSVKMTVSVDEKKKTFTLKKSEEAFNAAKELMPGGVNSPVRAFKSVGGQPIVIDHVKGSHMWDIDGNEYIDYVGSWGPAIIGHADDEVLAALAETMKKGTSFGAPCLLENVLAEMVIAAVPSIQMVRFVNSGTEACMGVLRLCRAFTGKEKIIKFEGCYHGHADAFLVKAGSGVATLGLPDSPGVPKAATSNTLTAPYNDITAVQNLFETHKGEIAAVILEPVVGNSGFITPTPEFLNSIREITKANDALLIFDEVMTGFRIAYGGAQEYYGVTPDLTTLGKIIGGGLPVGAYGGRRDIMEMVAPAGPMYQAGTLSGNPLAMTAGIHTLKRLKEAGSYEYLDKITSELIGGILEAGKKAGHAMCGGYISGMFGFFFTEGPVSNFEDAKKSDTVKFGKFYRGMLEEGVYLAPSQFEAGFTGLAHTQEDIQRTIQAADKGFIMKRNREDMEIVWQTPANPPERHDYIFRNGIRYVKPYYFEFVSHAKVRWAGKTIVDLFSDEFKGRNRDYYESAVKSGRIQVDGKTVSVYYRVQSSQKISHFLHRHEPPVMGLDVKILHKGEDVLTVCKPASVPVHPCGQYRKNTVVGILQAEHDLAPLFPIHRLDRLVSGLLILARSASQADIFRQQIESGMVQKQYIAKVVGEFPEEEQVVNLRVNFNAREGRSTVEPETTVEKVNGKAACTKFTRICTNGKYSIVSCHPITGRTHQIRVHLQSTGHPIANDPLYISDHIDVNSRRAFTAHKTAVKSTQSKSNDGGSEPPVEDFDIDPMCTNCPNLAPIGYDGSEEGLWLHCVRYSGPDWVYECPYPEWASLS